MLTVFFDSKGVVHYKYASQGRKINKEYYLELLRRLRDSVLRKRSHLWESENWLLHHDNAPIHSAHIVQNFLVKHGILQQLRQPPYSLYLAPCDFWSFPKLKKTLKGRRFDDVEAKKQNAMQQLLILKEKDFQDCFENWKKVIELQRKYLEGDVVEITPK
ncbi:hypothetical protein QLX08_005325 [Tetragonisca angustula]|uniref:Transposase n=1 Tax=Tetragonisca angustula TaxID=166442 RepID=A0AAW0ZYZ8_9HYME